MSDDRIKGAAHKAAGAVKEAAGKVTHDPTLEAKGKAEKTLGTLQNKAGKVEDAIRK
jgi:uncharacterized protein YjbJ (UPF0337 family)